MSATMAPPAWAIDIAQRVGVALGGAATLHRAEWGGEWAEASVGVGDTRVTVEWASAPIPSGAHWLADAGDNAAIGATLDEALAKLARMVAT